MPTNRPYYLLLLILSTLVLLMVTHLEKNQYHAEQKTIKVSVTTGMIGDLVRHITKGRADITILMKAGVDPHTYEATVRDAWCLENAHIIFFNGLHLEGTMHHNLANLSKHKPVYAVSDALSPQDLLADPQFPAGKDPHIWFDVNLWSQVARFVGDRLKEHDPPNADFYEENTQHYIEQLHLLDEETKKTLATIPKEQRILITSHDAFSYFGKRYQVAIKSLQGISTVTEPTTHQRIAIKNFILEKKLHGIFVEYSVNPKGIQAIQEDCMQAGHRITCYQLFSDTLGEENTPEGSYIGAFRYNLTMITKGLQHDQENQSASH